MGFLQEEVMFGYTLLQFLGAAAVVLVIAKIIPKIFSTKVKRRIEKKKCRSCNWTGPAAFDNNRCPKCRALTVPVPD